MRQETKWTGAFSGSSTRGLFGGGDPSSNTIAYVTLATTGNALNFGDLPYDGWGTGAVSNNTRWLNFGDYSTNRISYVTIASLGDAQDFGDLLTTGPYHKGCGSPVVEFLLYTRRVEHQLFNFLLCISW